MSLTPAQATELGIETVPFGDGGADDTVAPRPKLYTHGPCATAASKRFVLDCGAWRGEVPGSPLRQELAAKALAALREHGFVVLEGLLPPQAVSELEPRAADLLGEVPEGFVTQPLRAGRSQIHLPYAEPWPSDWLVKNDLILEVCARYVKNNLAGGRTQDDQQWKLVEWLTAGADLDWFLGPERGPVQGELYSNPPQGCSPVGSPSETGPWLGRVMVTKTPPGSLPQKAHRDINFPGPTAQLTIGVPLTPLAANNGPLGYIPGSHRMFTPGYEVVANAPQGSVVLYDSFIEHRGIENDTPRVRYAMYYEFETRGIFGGYTDEHFGADAAPHTLAYRYAVDPELRQWVAEVG